MVLRTRRCGLLLWGQRDIRSIVLRGDIEKLLTGFRVLRFLCFVSEPSRFLTVLLSAF
jgi:hypothetical protein